MSRSVKVSAAAKAGETIEDTLAILKETPVLWVLFLVFALIDFSALFVLHSAHSEPFSWVLAPIIRSFWGERFLHYPDNFALLPKLFNHANFLILSVFGILISGIVIKKMEARTENSELKISSAAGIVFKKYFLLLMVWLFAYGVFVFTLKAVLVRLPSALWIQLFAGFILSVLVQSLFTFLLPALVLSPKGFFRNLWKGMVFGFRYLPVTGLLIAVPMLVMTLLSAFKAFSPVFAQSNPEFVLFTLCVGIIISLGVDLAVTSSTTMLFLKERRNYL
jgi:uncharacterized membrane protein YesL